ncbi:MAG TPA: hypothetical protein DDX40_02105 [Rikenellaceae bacterium]|nr:hypothetical protein [Rikenellaceae bacterium]
MKSDDKAGLYITVIFHLTVVIVLLVCQISSALKRENTFVLDFSKQEKVEKEQAERNLKEEVSERLDRMLAEAAGVPIRNVAVDRGALKDDRNTNADELYKEAEELAQELKNGPKLDEPDEDYATVSKPERKAEVQKKSSYKGPSVVSYELDGRKASKLSIPAYRCLGAGHVTVIITVDPSGKVLNAKVQDEVSSDDKCLRDFATRAARLSRFSASATAPARQTGNIVYLFVAQ